MLFESEKLKFMGLINSAMGIGEVFAPFIGSMLYGILGYTNQFLLMNLMLALLIIINKKYIPDRLN